MKNIALFTLALINPFFALIIFFSPQLKILLKPKVLLLIIFIICGSVTRFVFNHPDPNFFLRFINSPLFLTMITILLPALLFLVMKFISQPKNI